MNLTVACSAVPARVLSRAPVRAVTRIPLLVEGARLLAVPGLDERTGIQYEPDRGLDLPPVAAAPTQDESDAAFDFLMVEVLRGVPFAGWRARAAALYALLSAFMRGTHSSPPSFVVSSDHPEPWASRVAQMLSLIVNGDIATVEACPLAVRRHMELCAAQGRGLAVIDPADMTRGWWRVQQTISSSAVRHGSQIVVNWPVWICVATEPFDTDDALRNRDIRLTRARRSEGHHDLDWVRANRPKIVQALLTLIRRWISQGAKPLVRDDWEAVVPDL
jgi:hypothetical protein